MGKRVRHLCDWSREEISERFSTYRKMVLDPRFVCRKCGRAAAHKKRLCKPAGL